MAARKRKPNDGLVLFCKISKQFTEINKKLPAEFRVPYNERKQIIKEVVYPKLKGTKASKVKVGKIRYLLNLYLSEKESGIPIKLPEKCNLKYVDPSDYTDIEFYLMDNMYANILPDCVFSQVSAGGYGQTRIFNTSNYSYSSTGLQAIVEAIRSDANSKSDTATFVGFVQVRTGRQDDNRVDSYFLNMVLYWNGKPITKKEPQQIPMIKTPEEKTKAKDLQEQQREIIADKIKKAKEKKKIEVTAKKKKDREKFKKEQLKKEKEQHKAEKISLTRNQELEKELKIEQEKTKQERFKAVQVYYQMYKDGLIDAAELKEFLKN